MVDKKDSNWVKDRIRKFKYSMCFFLTFPWIVLLVPMLLSNMGLIPVIIALIFFLFFPLTFIAGVFQTIYWFGLISGVRDNTGFIEELMASSNKEIWVADYSPFKIFPTMMIATVTFGSDGVKYPETFYITFRNISPTNIMVNLASHKKPLYPNYRIAIPFGIRPRVLIFKGKVHCDDEDVKKKIDGLLTAPMPTEYFLTIQQTSGFGGGSGPNCLITDVFEKDEPPSDILSVLKTMNSIKQICYGQTKINSAAVNKFGGFAIVVMHYCPKCQIIQEIKDWDGQMGRSKSKTCDKCGEKLYMHVLRWSQ
jgi:hypothetical protein